MTVNILDTLARSREENRWIVFFDRGAKKQKIETILFCSPHIETDICVDLDGLDLLPQFLEAFQKLPFLLSRVLHDSSDNPSRFNPEGYLQPLKDWISGELKPLVDKFEDAEEVYSASPETLQGFGFCFSRNVKLVLPEDLDQYSFLANGRRNIFTDVLHEWEITLEKLAAGIRTNRFQAACTALGLLCSISVYKDVFQLAGSFAKKVCEDDCSTRLELHANNWIRSGAERREEPSLDRLFCSSLRRTL